MKATTIFADQDQNDKKQNNKSNKKFSTKDVSLTKDEYHEIVKEAYKEGLKAALTEKVQADKTDEESLGKEEGQKAAAVSHAKAHEEAKRKFENISDRHDLEVMRAKTVFPFDLFPDDIIIDTTKVTIVKKQMFATEHVMTIPLKDLSDIHVQTALFLASITIKYMPHSSNPGMLEPVEARVVNLRRQDAIRAKNILKGILVAQSEEIDFTKLAPEEIVNMIEKFGNSEGVS